MKFEYDKTYRKLTPDDTSPFIFQNRYRNCVSEIALEGEDEGILLMPDETATRASLGDGIFYVRVEPQSIESTAMGVGVALWMPT